MTTYTTYQQKQYPQGGKPTVQGLGVSKKVGDLITI
jgi:hypothetical protein